LSGPVGQPGVPGFQGDRGLDGLPGELLSKQFEYWELTYLFTFLNNKLTKITLPNLNLLLI
jgi:hypothetical protein